jgi:hypothetical protein
VFLFFIISAARASVARWPATAVALVYTAVTLIMLVVMPLFPAQPLLGPIYVQVERFMPTDFPLLLLVPSLALDLVLQRRRGMGDWILAQVASAVFVVTFAAAQWPFADFLMTPAARNWFFVSHRMPYSVDPAMQARWYRLNPADSIAAGLPIAIAIGFVSARCGLWWGNWMARVQR